MHLNSMCRPAHTYHANCPRHNRPPTRREMSSCSIRFSESDPITPNRRLCEHRSSNRRRSNRPLLLPLDCAANARHLTSSSPTSTLFTQQISSNADIHNARASIARSATRCHLRGPSTPLKTWLHRHHDSCASCDAHVCAFCRHFGSPGPTVDILAPATKLVRHTHALA